ncbi:MAG TPA: hypothetical protein VJA85_01325 [Candidatus Limnocylindria bacterium]|nr:hypothetical protein [Candidatus Limnocylindria bacterium]
MQAFLIELPDRPGALAGVAEAVAGRSINITAVTGLAVSGTGALALTTDDEAGTRAALDAGGFNYRMVPLVSVALEDRPGTLAAAARKLANAGINLEAAFPTGMEGDKVVIAFAVADPAAAERALG